jgi:hypothetical protein
MTPFQNLAIDLSTCRAEVEELRGLLAGNKTLKEREQILPFFKQRRHLSAFIASYSPNIIRFDRLALDYQLFGDFTCDVAVGDSARNP